MLKRAVLGAVIGLASASQANAEVPKVAVDIAPLHSLVAQVMEGIGKPELLIRPEASPHEYSLRPSEAKALSDADIVFWIGEGLTPWLEKPLSSLASKATKIEMMEVDGTSLHDFREGATFEAHDHDHHAEHEQHDHDDHDDHEHKKEHQHHDDEHNDEHHHADHHHEGHDPHIWLDPVNAQVWVRAIAKSLAVADKDNAQAYQNNAKQAADRLQKLTVEIKTQAKSLEGIKFIVFHDAYQYFEQRFHTLASGAISISDASDPSPARIAEIRSTVKELGVNCVFTEPQFNPELVNTVFDSTTGVTIGTMDPIGANIPVGTSQYSSLLNAMLNSLKQCQG